MSDFSYLAIQIVISKRVEDQGRAVVIDHFLEAYSALREECPDGEINIRLSVDLDPKEAGR